VRWYEGPQPAPSVHFDPIAAGDAVLNDRDSALARWLQEHYNDAVAVEMESSGVAHAGHLLHATPTLTIRGISDFADGAKQVADNGGSQPLAAGNAAAFACALVSQLAAEQGTAPRTSREPLPSAAKEQHVHVQNSASGRARVGVQAGVVNGTIRLDGPPPDPAEDRVATVIAAVAAAYHSGRIDRSRFNAAIGSLEDIRDATGIDPARVRHAVRMLDSLFSRLPDLQAEVDTALSGSLE
jgi:adenosylhomocysteine nucleosidase